MKNIHILPTDKPSRLYEGVNKELKFTDHLITNKRIFCQNIYITSDEEIKEGGYAYHKIFGVGKIININGEDCFVTIKLNPKDGSITTPWKRNIPDIKKIILTTDPDLIKDGVQAINDEFLEWFIKNPSCKFIEVDDRLLEKCYTHYRENILNNKNLYKIIIPKEESKQETLEEAAEKWYDSTEENKGFPKIQAFKAGVKWQQERSYSEEEVLKLLISKEENTKDSTKYNGVEYITPEEWFEQFKKK